MTNSETKMLQAADRKPEHRNCSTLDRRALLRGAGLTLGGALLALPQISLTQEAAAASIDTPEYLFSILAMIGDVMTVGDSPGGQIRAIPITGGEVQGEGISGRVVPGGADWQRTRADGFTEIEATYALELSDGTLIKVINRGLIGRPTQGTPSYFRTVIHFDAPTGPWAWMNEAIFVCKAGLHPDRERTVLIEVFKLV